MAAIDTYLQQILDAIYGEEVRGAIHDSIAAMNVESTTAESAAISARDSAKVSASVAEAAAEEARAYAADAERYSGGGLVYKGSIAFADIPTSGMKNGNMYNMDEDFTTDYRFEEGPGIKVRAGTNIAWNGTKWDLLAIGGVDPNEVLYKDGSNPADYLTIGSRMNDETIGNYSLAIGADLIGSGRSSIAIGDVSESSGVPSIAMGYGARASGTRSIAIGVGTLASGANSIAVGEVSVISGSGNYTITGINGGTEWTPNSDLVSVLNLSPVHRQTISYNGYSYPIVKFEEGILKLGVEIKSDDYDEGTEVTLTVKPTGATTASGRSSHAEGPYSRATGNWSHAEGEMTQAKGTGSHSQGKNTIANYAYQNVMGKYNNNKSDTLLEVGNGTSTSTSNAFEVTSDGYIRTKGQTIKIAFGVDSEGNYGYFKEGADTVTPFKTGGGSLQEKTISPTTSTQSVTPDDDYYGLSKVTVNGIQTETKTINPTTSSQIVTPTSGKYFSQVTVNPVTLQAKSQLISSTSPASWSSQNVTIGTVTPDSSYTGMSSAEISVPLLRDGTLLTVSTTATPSTVYNGDASQSNTANMLRVAPTKNGYSYTGSYLYIAANSNMGDATASDVRSGKTFSSSAGIKVTGTATMGDELSFGSNFYPLFNTNTQQFSTAFRSNFGTVGKKYLVYAINDIYTSDDWDTMYDTSSGDVTISGSGFTIVTGYSTNKNAVVIQITSSSHTVTCTSSYSGTPEGVFGGIVELA